MDTISIKKRLGELRIQKKVIVNQNHPYYLDVVIGEIEIVRTPERDKIHYILNFGATHSLRIIGKDNWNKFLEMVKWLDWDPEDTQEFFIGEEGICHNPTLKYDHDKHWYYDDSEIIDGIPIDDDE